MGDFTGHPFNGNQHTRRATPRVADPVGFRKKRKPARAATQRRWYAAHRDEWKDILMRRRARVRGNGTEKVTAADRAALLRFQEGRCVYCTTPLGDDKHLDHVTPIARGGGHFLSNLAWACPPCNFGKNAKTAAEFRAIRKVADPGHSGL